MCLSTSVALASNLQATPAVATIWHVDSAATYHITFDRDAFRAYSPATLFSVEMGDLSASVVVGRGNLRITILVNEKSVTCEIKDVLHVPYFAYYLISVIKLASKGLKVTFTSTGVEIRKSMVLIAKRSLVLGLYELDIDSYQHHMKSACPS